jgi:hypothetical protein
MHRERDMREKVIVRFAASERQTFPHHVDDLVMNLDRLTYPFQ